MFKVDYIEDKGVAKISEDRILIKENLFGVFDGITGFVKYEDEQGKTGGFLAAEIARKTFESHDGNLIEAATLANKNIQEAMINCSVDISDKLNLWGTTIAVVKINENNFDWAQISDSLILIIYKDKTFKVLVDDYEHDKEWLKKWQELAQKQVLDVRSHLQDLLYKTRRESNIKYGVLNGENEAVGFLKSGKESLADVAHILIFTDGLFMPKLGPDVPDNFQSLVTLFLQGGLKKVKEHIRSLENEDPNCWKYIRLKQHDDIAAIAISFE